jgi:hypothetical protein
MAVDSARNIAPAEEKKVQLPRISKSLRIFMEEIRAVAQQFADKPVQSPEPGVWGLLTVISNNARHRRQVRLPFLLGTYMHASFLAHSLPAALLKP